MPRQAASSKGLRGSSVRRDAGDGAPVDVRGVMPLTVAALAVSTCSRACAISPSARSSARSAASSAEAALRRRTEASRRQLREKSSMLLKMAETLNSLGTLKQKRKQFADATEYFKRALSLRRDKLPSDKAGLAQAHLSLARLLVVDQPPADKQDERCNEALPLLEAALEQYLAAFHAQHPKVGWAHQGIAECMMKLGKLEKAQEHLDIALTISKTSPSRVTELQALGERVEQERAQKKALMRGASSKGLGSMWKKSAAKVLRAGSSSRNLFAPSAASPEGSQPPSPSSGFFRVVRLACATKWDSTSSGLGSPAAAGPSAATKSAKFGDQLQAAAAAARVNTTSASAAEEGRSESSKSLSEVAVEMPWKAMGP